MSDATGTGPVEMRRATSGAPSDVGVLGGGRMGAGIAHAFLLAGSRVTVVERDADAAAAASRRVLESVDASIARGTADELLPAAHAIADRIGRNDRAATIATKRVMRAPREAHPAVDLDEQAVLFESPEKMRRMTEFLERKQKK